MSVNRSSENKLTHAFLSFLFFSHSLIQLHFGLFDFFVFVLSNKYYLSKLMLLDFRCQKISFLCKHNFCIDEKNAQWMLDTKVKVFHESISCFMKWPWNYISWNALKEKFHSVSFPLVRKIYLKYRLVLKFYHRSGRIERMKSFSFILIS